MIITNAWAATPEATNSETGIAHETGGSEHGGGVFPPFDPSTFASQLLWLAISFGLFYWFVSRVAIPRIAGILEVRRDRISQDIDEAERLREEADAAHAAYEHELAEARSSAHAIAQDASEKAKAEAESERVRVEGELSSRLAEAEARIGEIRNKAMGEVDRIASDTAAVIVKELIGGSVTQAEIAKAVGSVAGQE